MSLFHDRAVGPFLTVTPSWKPGGVVLQFDPAAREEAHYEDPPGVALDRGELEELRDVIDEALSIP